MHNVGPGWSFLTGKPADVELLRSKLGFVDLIPQVDENDRASHSGRVVKKLPLTFPVVDLPCNLTTGWSDC
ncbi:MAG: hypothetical protein JF614_31295 [Acidobacteria bacterium]|nr:hypothetical protein [Acidobacteriota bacterium]